MKIVEVKTLVAVGGYAVSSEWEAVSKTIYKSVRACEWPPGAGNFTIYPESGKRRGQGNGVVPIKKAAMQNLVSEPVLGRRWELELLWPDETRARPGKMDAGIRGPSGVVCFEWETGNIASSHRSLNKIALGLMRGSIIAGVIVVPSRNLYKYLTDRIGNFPELEPYFDLWSSIQCAEGILQIIVIEQDAVSREVPRIPKMTAGRHLG